MVNASSPEARFDDDPVPEEDVEAAEGEEAEEEVQAPEAEPVEDGNDELTRKAQAWDDFASRVTADPVTALREVMSIMTPEQQAEFLNATQQQIASQGIPEDIEFHEGLESAFAERDRLPWLFEGERIVEKMLDTRMEAVSDEIRPLLQIAQLQANLAQQRLAALEQAIGLEMPAPDMESLWNTVLNPGSFKSIEEVVQNKYTPVAEKAVKAFREKQQKLAQASVKRPPRSDSIGHMLATITENDDLVSLSRRRGLL